MNALEDIFHSFELGIRSSKAVKPKAYLNSLGLDYNELRIGFNSGQFHHNKEQEFKDQCEALGLLVKSDAGVNKEGLTAYTVFGRYGVVFPLLNQSNEIVNLFAIRFELSTPVEEYLNEQGIYPSYPHPLTKKLFLVPTALDAASLMQSKALENRESVLALHDGKLLPQHLEAIKALTELEEIIILKN
ncbi:hypothetical protein [Flavobacterium sp.]|uniref:hypothetical protein n=1 Tax=Flavobacterium sp. TaxID=239 RepID=UPI00391BB16B